MKKIRFWVNTNIPKHIKKIEDLIFFKYQKPGLIDYSYVAETKPKGVGITAEASDMEILKNLKKDIDNLNLGYITIEKEVKIGNVILEKGDKIQFIEKNSQDVSLALGKTIVNVDDKTKNWGYADITFDDHSVLRVYDASWYVI